MPTLVRYEKLEHFESGACRITFHPVPGYAPLPQQVWLDFAEERINERDQLLRAITSPATRPSSLPEGAYWLRVGGLNIAARPFYVIEDNLGAAVSRAQENCTACCMDDGEDRERFTMELQRQLWWSL